MTLLATAGVIASCIGAATVIGVLRFSAAPNVLGLGVRFSSSVSLVTERAGVEGTLHAGGMIWAKGLRGVSVSRKAVALKDNFLMGRSPMSKPLLAEIVYMHQRFMKRKN